MVARTLVAVCIFLVAMSGCAQRRNVPITYSAFIREELVVHVPQKAVTDFIIALRHAAPQQPGVMVNVNEWQGGYGQTSIARPDAYAAALDDAQQKATTLARRIGARLGEIQSIAEFAGTASAAPLEPGLRVEAIHVAGSSVVVQNGRAVTLAVSYALSNGGAISVFGLADASAHGAAQGVQIELSANGSSIDAARQNIDAAETYVRGVAHNFGLAPSAISVTSIGFNRNAY